MSNAGPARDAPTRQESAFSGDPAAVYAFVAEFFSSLRTAGVGHVVISPGSRSTPLAIGAERAAGLRTWIELDERAAAFFALGIAKQSGRPAALVCTSGTAAANYLPAIVEAHYARVPLLVLTADRPPELRDWGAGQTIEQQGLFGRYPRWATEVPVPARGENGLRYATRLAARAVEMTLGTPAGLPGGAVHLNWPFREPLAPPLQQEGSDQQQGSDGPAVRQDSRNAEAEADVEADADAEAQVEADAEAHARGQRGERASGSAQSSSVDRGPAALSFSRGRVVADPADVAALVARVRACERGVLCAGPMDADEELVRALADFARASGWPLLADPASQLRSGALVQDGPILDLGDVLTRAPKFSERMRPDAVVRIGDTPVSKAQRLWLEAAAPESVWWLDEGGQWGEPSQRATHVVRGGAASLLREASASLHAFAGRERAWCRSFESANATARKTVDAMAEAEGAWSGVPVAAALARSMPADATLFASNSMSIRLLDIAHARRRDPLRLLCSRGASGIDGITSTALGVAASASTAAAAAAAQPGSGISGPRNATALLTGDLAFLHDLSGLLLARREAIALTIVVLDDNGGGIFSFLPVAQQAEDVSFARLFHTPHDVDLARVAALFELDYYRVESVGELEVALSSSFAHPGVSIVHAPVDATANAAAFRVLLSRASEAVDLGAFG